MKYRTVERELINKSKKEIIKEYIDLLEEKEKLEKELKKYKNSNTPSSSNKHLKPNTQGNKAKDGAKRGAPKGHKGTTRNQTPEKFDVVDADECPNCHGRNLKDEQVYTRTTEDIPESIELETVQTEIHKKKCTDCDYVFIPAENTIPLKGKFGINIMVLVIFMRFFLRGVLRKSAFFLSNHMSLTMAPASVNAIIQRVADASTKEYEELKVKIRNAAEIYVDETSFSVLGKNWWVWVFRAENTMLLVIRPSRGSNVLEEILGKEYAGTVICDCWGAYNFLSNALIQRCWAHLLRKSKTLTETVTGKHFHEKLKGLFEEIKEFNTTNPTHPQRETKYVEMTSKLTKILTYYIKYTHLTPVVNYISRKTDQWFTCIKIAGIEPTNNFAEQAIRETVMVRKIIGAFRSIKGVTNYETLASLLATWNIQKLDIKTQLRQTLIKNLCFC